MSEKISLDSSEKDILFCGISVDDVFLCGLIPF